MNAKLVISSGKNRGEIYVLSDGETFVGRESSCAIQLNDSSVSRRHCRLTRRGELFFVSDSESLNGTFVNGEAANETVLQNGDRIAVGDFVLTFYDADAAETSGSNQVFLDKTEFRLPKNSVQIRLDEAVGAMARDLTALLKISSKINQIYNVEELQTELLRQIFEVVPAETGAILLIGEGGEAAEIVGFNHAEKNKIVSVSQTIVRRVMSEQTVILANDIVEQENFVDAKSLLLTETESLLCVPLVLFEKSTGAIYLTANQRNANFDENHLRLVTAIAQIAAAAFENARNFAFLESENRRLQTQNLTEQNMLGESPAMQKVFRFIAKAAPTDANVLITGESGTGKELAARSIHLNSKRKAAPFVAINCAALTESLLESELFGHEKGAFTGAVGQKKGKIEIAESGTLFLDEIGEMALPLQAKILRVLQEREFERVGGTRTLKADVRLIAATNRDLEAEIRTGNFRQDLFYRLNVVQFEMPALRERREDVLILAEAFLCKFSRKMNRRIRGISAQAKKLLHAYDYPGNVRELENAIERAVVLGSSEWIAPEDLPDNFLEIETEKDYGENGKNTNYHDAIRETKKDLIRKAFSEARGNYTETAKILDVHPNYLHRLIRNLDIKSELEKKE
jgi:Nif-specific regulatory protein